MKNKEQFDWAVGVLVKAYFKGVLLYNECAACAVGNLIAAKNNYAIDLNGKCGEYWIKPSGERIGHKWSKVFCGQEWNDENYEDGIIELISTGYSVNELFQIERSFGEGIAETFNGDKNFNGLMAVVDCLIKIHEGTEQEAKEAKELFVKH